MVMTLNLDGRGKIYHIYYMTTITIPAINSEQATAIMLFLDARHVPYKMTGDVDETDYQLSFPANANHHAIYIVCKDIYNRAIV